jgi:hypothetical protein
LAAGALAAGATILVSLTCGWYALAVVALMALGAMAVQWFTIDPPYVDEENY